MRIHAVAFMYFAMCRTYEAVDVLVFHASSHIFAFSADSVNSKVAKLQNEKFLKWTEKSVLRYLQRVNYSEFFKFFKRYHDSY